MTATTICITPPTNSFLSSLEGASCYTATTPRRVKRTLNVDIRTKLMDNLDTLSMPSLVTAMTRTPPVLHRRQVPEYLDQSTERMGRGIERMLQERGCANNNEQAATEDDLHGSIVLGPQENALQSDLTVSQMIESEDSPTDVMDFWWCPPSALEGDKPKNSSSSSTNPIT